MKFSFLSKAAALTAIGGVVLLNAQDGGKKAHDHAGHDHAGHDHAGHDHAKDAKKVAAKPIDLGVAKLTVSKGYGHNVGSQLNRDKEIVDLEAFIQGVRAGFAGKPNEVKREDFEAAMKSLQGIQKAKQDALAAKKKIEDAKLAAKIKPELNAFLAETLIKTKSGLEYKIVKKGDGASPVASDTVTVHYTGYLTDGTKFDSSVDRGQPASFPLGNVIKGWTEGLQLMKVGSKYRFKIPADLAYGANGQGPIPANSTLIFDVELIAIQKAK